MNLRQTERGDFTKQAAVYALARPGYPLELIDRLMKHVGIAPNDPVADLGAGSGQCTRLLVERGLSVTAVEPNQAMRSHAPRLPNVRWVDGTFERTTLEDHSQSWCIAAQSFHWADPARALPELRRILQPGGSLTAMWNKRQNEKSEVLQASMAIIREFDDTALDGGHDKPWADVLTSTGDFTNVVRREAEHEHEMSAEDYPLFWLSRNRCYVALGDDGCNRLRDRLVTYLQRQGLTKVCIPYKTLAWTVRRVD